MQAASEARNVTFEHEVIEESSLRTQLCYVMLDVEWMQGSGTYSTLWKY
jgi:hypothetical protein